MTAQETENQAGGAEPSNDTVAGEDTVASGNDGAASANADAGSESTGTTATLAEDAGSTASSSETAPQEGAPAADAGAPAEFSPSSEPKPDIESQAKKTHDAAIAFIIATRLLAVDAIEYLKAKIEEIKD